MMKEIGKMFKLDVPRYIAHHQEKLNLMPTSEAIKSVEMIVDWCSRAYLQGQNRIPFAMPYDIPVIRQIPNMQATICLECGEVAVGEASLHGNTLNMICNHCDASINIDLDMGEDDSAYMS
jgi:hypothetical protein